MSVTQNLRKIVINTKLNDKRNFTMSNGVVQYIVYLKPLLPFVFSLGFSLNHRRCR